jgi:large subunit ribosomal protein L29
MKPEEIRALSTDAIRAKIDDVKEELMRLRFQQATGELTDHTRLRYSKRTIARLYTILAELERAAQAEGEG